MRNSAEREKLVRQQIEFAFRLLRQSVQENSETSCVFSPISISVVLAMIYGGARGRTADELAQLLAGCGDEDIHQYFSCVNKDLSASGENYTLKSVNRAYIDKKFTLSQTYKELIEGFYKSQLETVDFSQDSETIALINNFVEEYTEGKIKEILPPKCVSHQTPIVLVNAIYFNGEWARKFDPKHTHMETFYCGEGQESQVEMMTKYADIDAKYAFYENEKLQCLALPYSSDNLTMYCFLPKPRYALPELLTTLNGNIIFTQILPQMCPKNVEIKLPKFRIESSHDLKQMLPELGVQTLFSSLQSDLSGLFTAKEIRIYVEKFFQKTVIQTDEAGSEASAATAAVKRFKSFQPYAQFHATQPFAFLLLDVRRTVLFCGIVRKE